MKWKLIERLKLNKPMAHQDLIDLALAANYTPAGRTGSHAKFEKEGVPNLTIVISKKRDNVLIQYNVIRALRLAYNV